MYPLSEVLLLLTCATICSCDDFDEIAAWGESHLDFLVFKDDLSRYRKGNGAKNMAVMRRFALNLVRANKAKVSAKTKRKLAGWDPEFLLEIL